MSITQADQVINKNEVSNIKGSVLIPRAKKAWFLKASESIGLVVSEVKPDQLLSDSIVVDYDYAKVRNKTKEQVKSEVFNSAIHSVTAFEIDFSNVASYRVLATAKKASDSVSLLTVISSDFSFNNYDVNYKRCDHCHKAINRNQFYVIDLGGERLQLGGSCAKKMNVHKTLNSLTVFFDMIDQEINELIENFKLFGSEVQYNDFKTYAAFIIAFGYKSKKWNEHPTSAALEELSLAYSNPESTASKAFLSNKHDKIENALKSLPKNFKSDLFEYWEKKQVDSDHKDFEFLNNCLAGLCMGNNRVLGLVAYAIYDYLKQAGYIAAKPKKNEVIIPAPLEQGKTRDIDGLWTVYSCNDYVSEGYSYNNHTTYKTLVKAKDSNDHHLQFYINTYKSEGIELNAKLSLRAGVKGLNSKGTHAVLTRVKYKVV